VWIIQILSMTELPLSPPAREARRRGNCEFGRKDLKDPHAAAVWDSLVFG